MSGRAIFSQEGGGVAGDGPHRYVCFLELLVIFPAGSVRRGMAEFLYKSNTPQRSAAGYQATRTGKLADHLSVDASRVLERKNPYREKA